MIPEYQTAIQVNVDVYRLRRLLAAANLVDPAESQIAPKTELIVDGKKGGEVGGFKVGVRRELWIYILMAVALISAIEWATYHRRVTV